MKKQLTIQEFFLYTMISFIIIAIGYVIIVDQFVFIKREVPFTYRQFLLENTQSIKNKIIIESGSNSIHAIDPLLLTNDLNKPVVTIADNGDYPLRLKIFNLEKYLQADDTLILPLEWNQYYYESSLPKNFIKALADRDLKLEYYYNHLPIEEKLRFIFTQYPLTEVYESLKYKRDTKKIILDDFFRLNHFLRQLQGYSVDSLGGSSRNGPEQRVIAPINKTCTKYLFHGKRHLSAAFKDNLKLLKKLKDNKNLNIYFLWPTVVDHKSSTCYKNIEQVREYADIIRKYVIGQGFQFIGDFSKNHFTEKCFLNTHYHITHDCAITRTRELADELKNNLDIEDTIIDSSQINSNQLIKKIIENTQSIKKKLEKKINQYYPDIDLDKRKHQQLTYNINFIKGWSEQESWGIWSLGSQSELDFYVPEDLLTSKQFKLTIKGKYFNGVEKTKVTVNDQYIGQYVLENKTFIIDSSSLVDNKINMILQHSLLKSPAELGKSHDNRKIKFGLYAISIERYAPKMIRNDK